MNSEIAILFIRSAIEHSSLKNLLLLCLLERILVLKKKNSEFLWQEFLKFDSVRKICDKIFFPEELSVSLLAEKNSRSWEKIESPILGARISENAILSMRFPIKHSFQNNSPLHYLLKRILILEKKFPVPVERVSKIEILFKVFRCNAFLPQEFSSVVNLVSRTSILLERITIKNGYSDKNFVS